MSLKRGIGIIDVPLLGLGTDQVAKEMHTEKNVEAWHVDEFCGNDGKLLRKQLQITSPEDMENMSFILYMSPRSLLPDSVWAPVLRHLSKAGCLRMIFINKAHLVHLHGNNF